MAYDEALAEQVRAALGVTAGVTEIKMFGGLCWTINGNMAVGAVNEDLMVRLPPDEGEAALTEPHARPMDFSGKPMRGFVFVGPTSDLSEKEVASWVSRGAAFAGSLPPKQPKKPKKPKPRD